MVQQCTSLTLYLSYTWDFAEVMFLGNCHCQACTKYTQKSYCQLCISYSQHQYDWETMKCQAYADHEDHVCLQPDVLETVYMYYQYKQQYSSEEKSQEE